MRPRERRPCRRRAHQRRHPLQVTGAPPNRCLGRWRGSTAFRPCGRRLTVSPTAVARCTLRCCACFCRLRRKGRRGQPPHLARSLALAMELLRPPYLPWVRLCTASPTRRGAIRRSMRPSLATPPACGRMAATPHPLASVSKGRRRRRLGRGRRGPQALRRRQLGPLRRLRPHRALGQGLVRLGPVLN